MSQWFGSWFGDSASAGGGGGGGGTITLTIADNGDGTGGVATIAGVDTGQTVTLYAYNPLNSSWVTAGTRTGNGTISFDIADAWYFFYAVGQSGGVSVASLVTPLTAISSGPYSVEEQLKDFVEAEIVALGESIDGWPANVYNQMVMPNHDIAKFPAIFVTAGGVAESMLGYSTNQDDYGRPVVVSIVDRNDQDYTAKEGTYLYWRQTLMRHFNGQRPAGIDKAWFCTIEPAPIFDPKLPLYSTLVSAFVLRFRTREPRTP